jgi:predicted AlkP superfamily phosphohydrolase/phosphomutase
MKVPDRGPVLAIGIDAAEPTLVRRLLDRGDLPSLRNLAREGVWGPVVSPEPVNSGAMWPSFLTGTPPAAHGLFGEWAWRPETMDLARPSWDHFEPFWGAEAKRGRSVAVLDVPFAPLLGIPGCSEVLDWGAHDYLKGRLEVSPPSLATLVRRAGGTHPFAAGAVDAAGPRDHAGLERLVASCVQGVEQRGRLAERLLVETAPDLFVLVFPEVHHAEHLLWHAIDPAHPDHGLATPAERSGQGIGALLQAVDRAIGRLRDVAGPQATVLVFSLHGMRAARGIPTILERLLRATGFAVERPWRRHSRAEAARRAAALVKGSLPGALKRLYHRRVPRAVTLRLSQPAMWLPAYDWSRTTAFSLPTDQNGWVRLNLRGRETQGIVEPGGYEELCARLERTLRGARHVDGRPIVRAVFRTAPDAAAAATSVMPDLVVTWDDATFDSPLRLAEPRVAAPAVGQKFTGQHASEGFYLLRTPGGRSGSAGRAVAPEAIHRLLHDGAAPAG